MSQKIVTFAESKGWYININESEGRFFLCQDGPGKEPIVFELTIEQLPSIAAKLLEAHKMFSKPGNTESQTQSILPGCPSHVQEVEVRPCENIIQIIQPAREKGDEDGFIVIGIEQFELFLAQLHAARSFIIEIPQSVERATEVGEVDSNPAASTERPAKPRD